MTFCFTIKAVAFEWQQPVKGLYYTQLRVGSPNQESVFEVFRVDLKKWTIKPLRATTRKTAKQFLEEQGALVVINANFFDDKFQPLGLVQEGGRILNPFKNITWWSVFCLKNKKPSIVHSSQAKGLSCDVAVQAGPRVVVDGKIPQLQTDLSRRTALGINRKQEVLLVVSHDFISTAELAQIFAKPEAAGGLDCPNALNLDGGSSSQMAAAAGSVHVDSSGMVGVPVGLGVWAP